MGKAVGYFNAFSAGFCASAMGFMIIQGNSGLAVSLGILTALNLISAKLNYDRSVS